MVSVGWWVWRVWTVVEALLYINSTYDGCVL